MAWLERRPELELLCRAAQSDGGLISGATVQQVLPGLSDIGADNVVSWCRMLQLCDEKGGLTSSRCPNNTNDFPSSNAEANSFEHLKLSVGLVYFFGYNHAAN